MPRLPNRSKHDVPLFENSAPSIKKLARQARAESRQIARGRFWQASPLNPASPNYGEVLPPLPTPIINP
jgi:hypothetical protein